MTQFFQYLAGGIGSGAVIALMAIALVLTWRATRVVNFAQVGQAMFTTFVALSVAQMTGSWWLALLAAIVAGALLGVVVQVLVLRPVARMDTSGAIIATFGVMIALQALAAMVWGGDPQSFPHPFGTQGLSIGGTVWPITQYDIIVFAVSILLVLGLSLLLTKTNFGLAMRASAFNPEVARLSGIRVSLTRTYGWMLAGVVGGIAGVLVAPTSAVSPNAFDILLVFAFTAAVIGGLDSLVGAVVLGIGTGLVMSLVSGYGDSGNAPIVALVLLAINLLTKPTGIFGHSKARAV